MTMFSKNQYLKELRKEYLKTKSKKRKGELLDEAEKRTGLNRKYLMEKLRPKSNLDNLKTERKKRKQEYGNEIKSALKRCWEIFDKPPHLHIGVRGISEEKQFSKGRCG